MGVIKILTLILLTNYLCNILCDKKQDVIIVGAGLAGLG